MKAYPLLFFVIIFFTAFSCKKDNNNEPDNNDLSIRLTGTWDVDTIYSTIYYTNAADKVYTTFPNSDYARLTFRSDKTYTSEMYYMGMPDSNNGSYSVRKNKITIKPAQDNEDAVLPLNTMNCKINGDNMTLIGGITEDDLKTEYEVLLTKG